MKRLAVFLGLGLAGWYSATPASAQAFYPGSYGYPGYSNGSGFGFAAGFSRPGFSIGGSYSNLGYGYPGYGYGAGYGFAQPYYGRGHFDVWPGHFDRYRGGYYYSPPHVDYHRGGGRYYEVIPGPFGNTISPFPHRHRH